MQRATLGCLILGAIVVAGAGRASAASCQHGGKRYAVYATRCEDGKQLRCVGENEWKEIGKCAAPAPARGPQFCEHGGKKYSIHATRCEAGRQLRCVAKDEWKEIGRCK